MGPLSNIIPGPHKYEIEVIIIRSTSNTHVIEKTDKLDYFYTLLGVKYQISRENLFRVTPGLLNQAWDKLRGVAARYLIIFWENDPVPINESPAKVSPAVLETVKNSRALGKAIRELFKSDILGGRGLIFFVIVFVVLTVLVLKLRGMI